MWLHIVDGEGGNVVLKYKMDWDYLEGLPNRTLGVKADKEGVFLKRLLLFKVQKLYWKRSGGPTEVGDEVVEEVATPSDSTKEDVVKENVDESTFRAGEGEGATEPSSVPRSQVQLAPLSAEKLSPTKPDLNRPLHSYADLEDDEVVDVDAAR